MTQLQSIKAEIERRMKCYDRDGVEPNDAKWTELISVKHFIESLEKEQNVDLDDEIDNFLYPKGFVRKNDGIHTPGVCWRDWKGKKYVNRDVTPEDMRKFARHFWNKGYNARKEE